MQDEIPHSDERAPLKYIALGESNEFYEYIYILFLIY